MSSIDNVDNTVPAQAPVSPRELQTALVLANAGSVVTGIVRNIAGNDIATSLNGTRASSAMIQTLTTQRILKNHEVR